MKRIYYRFDLTLLSPLALSSGENERTDSDAVLDSRGKPYIPATSLAGILASASSNEIKKKIYGYINEKETKASSVIFYDCELTDSGIGKKRSPKTVRN